ncbi:hypothetical protein OAL11_00610 [bacterium]|nr:hypothetical protein [bacterium]
MGAKTNLALVQGVQVVAVALVIGVAYASTLELLKQKKIDLHDIELKKENRPIQKVEHPNEWQPKPKTTVEPQKVKSQSVPPPRKEKPKELEPKKLETKQPQTDRGCRTPPGGGPPVTADFTPC